MTNSKRKTDQLDKYKFKSVGNKPMGKKPIVFRVPEEHYEKFMAIPNDLRSKLLRDFIAETIEKFDAQNTDRSQFFHDRMCDLFGFYRKLFA